jgi:hypothetical protein
MEILQLLCSRRYCPENIPQLFEAFLAELSSQLTGSPQLSSLIPLCMDRVEITDSNSNSLLNVHSSPRDRVYRSVTSKRAA